jgi:4-hydroxy-2-oxoheptanedioate aldolase
MPSPVVAEVVAHAGFDWMCIDMQHAYIGFETLVNILAVVTATGTPAIVRVPWNEPGDIMRALEAGAVGVIVPVITSATEVVDVVRACRYPPDGYRSSATPTRSFRHGFERLSPSAANQAVLAGVMLETKEAYESVDEIASVRGLDLVFIGPEDLALSAGLDVSIAADAKKLDEMVNHIQTVCRKHDVMSGIFCGGADPAVRWRNAGFSMLALHTDAALLGASAREMLSSVRSHA